MFSKKDAVTEAKKQEQEAATKHARLSTLQGQACAELRQADKNVRAADIESGSFKDLVGSRRLIADRVAEIEARLTQAAEALASAKVATVGAVEAAAAEKAAAEAAARAAEKAALEADLKAKTLEFVTFLAKGVARVKELDAGRPNEIAPSLWAGTFFGQELLFAARIPELVDRAGKAHALSNTDPVKAVQFATGEASW